MINSTAKSPIILFTSSGLSLQLQPIDLHWIDRDNVLCECRITFKVTSQIYQQIDRESLFNLKLELRGALNAVSFQDDIDIEIEATLQPQLLARLAEHSTDSETAINYLATCSQNSSSSQKPKKKAKSDTTDESLVLSPEIDQILSTESWFALSVKQPQETGEISYRTFWSYLNPVNLTPEAISNGKFPEAMAQFLKDRNEANLAVAEKAITEVLEGIANDLKNWDETEFVKETESVISNFFAEVTDALESLVELDRSISNPKSSTNSKANAKGKIYQAMLNFFSEEDWEFTKLQGELTLRLACQGKNGRWNCFSLANETQERFLFYSLCPLEIPSIHRLVISEFLTYANYGISIGNFELDFTSGEIRYKTSIDVEGDRLTHALIKRLVYTNVTMMNEYLPGIQSIIEQGLGAQEAITLIETPNI
jgi:hypothetical protein